MKALALVIISTFMCISTAVAAKETAQVSSWHLEPKQFLGLNLSGDFINDTPDCKHKQQTTTPLNLCREATERKDLFSIRGQQRLDRSAHSTTVKLIDGKFHSLHVTGNAEGINNLTEKLTTTYGEPTVREFVRLEANSGYSFVSEVLTWRGKTISMKLQRNTDDIKTYSIIITNNNVDLDPIAGNTVSNSNEAASAL